MRGLPPPPPEVWRVSQDFQLDETRISCGWWIFNPGGATPSLSDLTAFASAWILGPLAKVLEVLAADTSAGVFQIATHGSPPVKYVQQPPPNRGLVDGRSAPVNVCAVWSWFGTAGRRARSLNLLPCAMQWVDTDAKRTSGSGLAALRLAALDFLSAVNAIPGVSGAPCSLVGLHRASHAAPLPVSEVDLVTGCNPALLVGTCDRRIRSSR